ncbi:MAG: 2-C-methyl-D-erythritol 2,4-cyclodiphosphate synthase [Chloroflexi bacterium]|nr:2-C-methyl-D-erythritol 2,4-cyclodiphosphate synthase [Chloroflexota bacterium]
MRVGHGYDIHRLAAGRPLMIGGVQVPSEQGAVGHSDADVLLHAVVDAILGALKAGDIGRHYPDSDPAWRGADSTRFARETAARARDAGWEPVNVDATVLLERPKLAGHVPAIEQRVAECLDVAADRINVKAATNEGLDAVGQGRAVACHAVVLLARRHR